MRALDCRSAEGKSKAKASRRLPGRGMSHRDLEEVGARQAERCKAAFQIERIQGVRHPWEQLDHGVPEKGEESINQLLLGLQETGDGTGAGRGHLDKTKEAGSRSPPGLHSLLPGSWVAKPPTRSGSQLLHPPDKNSGAITCSWAASILDPTVGGQPRAEQGLPPLCPDTAPKARMLSAPRLGEKCWFTALSWSSPRPSGEEQRSQQ